jgi:3-hydroxyacyl-CoA dehydrogenase
MQKIDKVTVIGANGTMGQNIAAIFASFGNAEVYLVSRTKQKSILSKNKAYHSVRAESIVNKMIPVDFDELEECVNKSELIFEACKEDWDVKIDIHTKISDVLRKADKNDARKYICSGTSGLSITKLAELYPEKKRSNIVGMHFFNPPYNMTLCELVPTEYTDRSSFESLKEYATTILRRTVVEVKDSPAFLGNRIGFQFINEALQYAEKYKFNGGIDYIDAILGPFTGRAMSPLVTANFVGLDVHKAIVDNLYENTSDCAHDTFVLPEFVNGLVKSGKLGRKTKEGLYRTIIHDSGFKIRQVYDIEHGEYRETIKYIFPFVEEMIGDLKVGNYGKAFDVLTKNRSIEAEICCEFLLKYIVYSLVATELVGYDIHAADDVMATGFNWCPPLALLEAFGGVESFLGLCRERLRKNMIDQIDWNHLSRRIEKSNYDYRRFLRAKK